MSILLLGCLVQVAQANVLGDMQTFAPSSDGQDFITVHSGRPLKKGFWAFSGYFNYAKNHLLVYDNMVTQEQQSYSDQLAEFDLDVAYAWRDSLQFFLAAPALLYQAADSDMNPRISVTRGVHTWRPGMKWTFYDQDDTYWATILSMDFLNVLDNPYTGENAQPILNLELSGTWKTGNFAKALNFGYRSRHAGSTPASARMFPLNDQFIASAGLSGAFSKSARWVTEAIFSYPLNKDPYIKAMDAASVDLLVGFKHRWITNLNFDWGATVEPGVKTLAPAWRVFTGLVYYWGPQPEPKAPIEEVPLQKDLDFLANPTDDGFAQAEAFPLKVTPEYSEVFEGSRLQIKADGGTSPYAYRVIRGGGRVNPSGIFRAPTKAGNSTIEVADAAGQVRQVRVLVKSPPKPDRLIRLGNLKFKFNSNELVDSSQKELDGAIRTLRSLKVKQIIVEGHTDSIGDAEYNQDLSEQRAGTIGIALVKRLNLPASNVYWIGYGEERPVADNKTKTGRQKNRRVDLKVYFN